MKTLHFKKFFDCRYFEPQLGMYLKDDDGEFYIIKDIVFEKYEATGEDLRRLNEFGIKINDDELKRMSKEIYEDLSEQTQYLKGSLEATKEHLNDMRKLVFKE